MSTPDGRRCVSCVQTDATHDPCCSSHGKPLCCRHYRWRHFVEVRPCCDIDRDRIKENR